MNKCKEFNTVDIKDKIKEAMRFEFGYAPNKKEISVKSVKGNEIEFYVNGYWYKIDSDGFVHR